MPMYLGRFRYTPDAIKALVENPHDRARAAGAAVESVGGTLHGFWYAFGEFDGYFLMEAPDNSTAMALSATVAQSGALSTIETIPLMSVEEGIEALRKTQSAVYAPPTA
ncbi:MAG TPA: GYD domain-containing protein [Thermoleophilaceae bacterium]